jgi:hypothetical protein
MSQSRISPCKYAKRNLRLPLILGLKFIFCCLIQLECDVMMPEIECGSLPVYVSVSQIHEVPSGHASPACCEEHLSRIAKTFTPVVAARCPMVGAKCHGILVTVAMGMA